jgi:hypothetical protein
METLTVAGPDVPGEVVPPPPPHAASAAEIARAKTRYAIFRMVRSDVLIMLPSSFFVLPLLLPGCTPYAVRDAAVRVPTGLLC